MSMDDEIEAIRREAKRISRATTITHSQALDVLAVQKGFSHWGALKQNIEDRHAPLRRATDGTISPAMLIDRLIRKAVPAGAACRDARHLIISGVVSTGKSTALNLMIREMPDDVVVWLSGTTGRVDLDRIANRVDMAREGSDMNEKDHLRTAEAAVKAEADVLVFDEISNANAKVMLDVARTPGAPMILAVVHASDVDHVMDVVSERAGGRDRIMPEDRFAVMQLKRSMNGGRIISDIKRI